MLIHSWVLSGEPQLRAFTKNRNSEDRTLIDEANNFLAKEKGIFEFIEHPLENGFKCVNTRNDCNNIISLELTNSYRSFIKGKQSLMFGFAPRHSMVEVTNQEVLRNYAIWEMIKFKDDCFSDKFSSLWSKKSLLFALVF